jgi:dCTP deaminase
MLCYEEILEEMEQGNIVIDPFRKELMNPNSVDVRLGNWFIPLMASNGETMYADLYYAPDGVAFPIFPGTTTLGMTKEIIGAYKHIVHQLRSKSSTLRKGITVCDDAGFGDIGYCNHWTVELTAHIGNIVKLTVGEPFGQIVFDRTGRDTDHPYVGQYNEDDWPISMIPSKRRRMYEPFIEAAKLFVKEQQPEVTTHFRIREFSLLNGNSPAKDLLWTEPFYL